MGDLIRYNSKVVGIDQDDRGVTVVVRDSRRSDAQPEQARADWCVCTIPLSILSQIDINVGAPDGCGDRGGALHGRGQGRPAVQAPLLGSRTSTSTAASAYTDLPIRMISYPSTAYDAPGKGVLLGAYTFGPYCLRVHRLAARGARASARWTTAPRSTRNTGTSSRTASRSAGTACPGALGCYGAWTDAKRAEHYDNLCALDGRIVLAGEHASYIPAWQEGAILSSLDAISRLHRRVVAA